MLLNIILDTYVGGLEVIYDLIQAGIVEKDEPKSEADMRFEELGYEKIENRKDQVFHIEYAKYDEQEDKSITIQFWNDESFDKINNFEEVEYITMQELKAINKKCQELGWIE